MGAKQKAALAAVSLTMFDGAAYLMNNSASDDTIQTITSPTNSSFISTENTTLSSESANQNSKDTGSVPAHPGKNTGNVMEMQYGAGGEKWGDLYIKNISDINPDFTKLLESPLGFQIDNSRQVQVLIVHTHTCEAYMDSYTGYYYTNFYPRTTDNNKNVTQVGAAIAKSLKKAGIGVIDDKTIHDDPSYSGSYGRSEETIKNYLLRYPNIKVILDIHRDAIHDDEQQQIIKPTFTYNKKKAAQIMIVAGNDDDGSFDCPTWEKNLTFALKLQETAEKMYPGMTRPIRFMNEMYNTFINSGSLLIEVGTDANTIEEAKYSGELLGKALAEVLQK